MTSEPPTADRLLLLDDDAGILRLQRRSLERAGFAVTTTETPGAAREQLRDGTFALLVLDYRLEAGQSGLEFYQQLRVEGFDVPAILVTAFSDESKLVEALRAGVRDVIPKSGEYLEYLPQAVTRVMAQIAGERSAAENAALRSNEERLRALNADLARSERQLRAQAEQLAEANRSKDVFLATLAHELRNPLAPIRYAVALMRDVPPPFVRARDVIGRQLAHLVRLVDDLLDVSRITRDKIQLQRERVKLAAILDAAIESVRPDLEAARHTLVWARPPDVALDVDQARLIQVFTNLLNNAAKYTPPDGRIEVAVVPEGGEVRVTVSDSGVGISPEHLPRVFDMFYQAADNSSRPAGGLGIGLMLVRRLVQMHGGRVEAKSAGAGQGSTFTVWLPLPVSAAEPAPETRDEPASTEAPHLRVLVVDDNVDSAGLLGLVVQTLGHDVRTAHDAASALAVFDQFQPDAALLDIGLPGRNGYTLARDLRRVASRDLLLVAITGWGQDDDRRKAREAGFDCHLVKPADPRAVARLLECFAGGEPCDMCERCATRA